MTNNNYHDPMKEINEVQNQLSYSKRLGFFLGAGMSKALGVPDISVLTKMVEEGLQQDDKDNAKKIKGGLQEQQEHAVTIEDVLNQTRLIRQITGEKETKNYDGVDGKAAKNLDIAICNKIFDIISEKEKDVDLSSPQKFASWLNWLSRDFTKEVYTTNYDLIIEKAFESLQIPYFDGFVGANEPFFLAESIEGGIQDLPPKSWIRLWKLHGSLGWFWKQNAVNKSYRVVRTVAGAKEIKETSELVIYPSKDKYESSRKQPFIAYFDRLKAFLQSGEGLLIISGYSFSDEHINAVIFDSLKQNNRLHINCFFYTDDALEKLNASGNTFLNLSAFSPKKGTINGQTWEWKAPNTEQSISFYWNKERNQLKLGDFKELVQFLLVTSGKQEKIEEEIIKNNEG